MRNTAPKRNEVGEVPRPKGVCKSIPNLHKTTNPLQGWMTLAGSG